MINRLLGFVHEQVNVTALCRDSHCPEELYRCAEAQVLRFCGEQMS